MNNFENLQKNICFIFDYVRGMNNGAAMHPTCYIIAFLGATFLEIECWWQLWDGNAEAVSFNIPLLTHFAVSIIGAYSLQSLLPRKYRSCRISGLVFFFSIILLIPVIGLLGLGLIVLPVLSCSEKSKEENVEFPITKIPELPSKLWDPDVPCADYEEGKLMDILLNAKDPLKRFNAVLETLRLREQDAILLRRVALKDPEDDVRLLAYALLDRKDQAISKRIDANLNLVEYYGDVGDSNVHQRIAYDCWELIYLGLAQDDVMKHLLDTAQYHLSVAESLEPEHAGLYFLRGKILLKQRDLDKAFNAFQKAVNLGIDLIKVTPYLEEIALKRENSVG